MLLHQLGELGNLQPRRRVDQPGAPSASKNAARHRAGVRLSLFERSARGLSSPSSVATWSSSPARRLVDFERFIADLEASDAGASASFVVGGIMGAAPDVVARAVADLKKKRPLLAVAHPRETSDQLLDLLQRRELDLAVGRFSAPMQHNRRTSSRSPTSSSARIGEEGATRSAAPDRSRSPTWWTGPGCCSSSPALRASSWRTSFAQRNLRTPENLVECGSIFAIAAGCCSRATAVAVLPSRWCATRSIPGCCGACRSRWAASSPTSAC